MLAYILFAFFGGYALFLLGFAVFMYFENQKFGDNQFTMKLLPRPPKQGHSAAKVQGAAHARKSAPVSDWTAAPDLPLISATQATAGAKTFTRTR